MNLLTMAEQVLSELNGYLQLLTNSTIPK